MDKNLIKAVIAYSAKPPTIFYPIPLLPILIVGFADGSLLDIAIVILFTSLFYSALNLWNHVNDYKEDFEAGKNTPFIYDNVRKATTAYVFLAYALSLVIFFTLSSTPLGKILFTIVLLLTFLYSDNMITKLRLKKHYATELLTYIVCVPSFILSLHDLVKPINDKAVLLSLSFSPFVISTVFIKDLKDISEDRRAGWKTLGVVFEAENLIKTFFCLNILFYITFAAFSQKFIKISPIFPIAFSLIPAYYFVKSSKENWAISFELARRVQMTVYAGFFFTIIYAVLFYFE
ncbi:conserved hypothetical protein [Ferroglobus placidus DSM 10642]|uniref:UbiA prenyltransferase n=1 Tax=Ferroglobus placidus (strain DSM 10642 / AEDII12DO) TaxID=589924 RepID=D3RYN9_FERPA|nr:UbiA family prenyltransferase [Ferroglobus placidus]ADC65602.1 conserved hypothetical protein [Ferroglobus placidus DSM 10642]